jgi:hypothetical protein
MEGEYLRGMTPIWTALTGVAALVALVLSIWNFWLAQRARGRADIHVAFRSFVQGKQNQTWLVISNRGQATAKDVRASFTASGKEWKPRWSSDPFPIPLIASGHSVPTRTTFGLGGNPEEGRVLSRISWRDSRMRRQHSETTLSLTALPFGGGATTESVMSDIAALGRM